MQIGKMARKNSVV